MTTIDKNALFNISYYLDLPSIRKCGQVSKPWKQITDSNDFWTALLIDLFQSNIPAGISDSKALYKRVGFLPKELIGALDGLQNYLELPKNEPPNATELSKWEFFNKQGGLSQLQLTVPIEMQVNGFIDKNFLIMEITTNQHRDILPYLLFRLYKQNDSVARTLKALRSVPRNSEEEEDRAVQERMMEVFQGLQTGELDLSRIFD